MHVRISGPVLRELSSALAPLPFELRPSGTELVLRVPAVGEAPESELRVCVRRLESPASRGWEIARVRAELVAIGHAMRAGPTDLEERELA